MVSSDMSGWVTQSSLCGAQADANATGWTGPVRSMPIRAFSISCVHIPGGKGDLGAPRLDVGAQPQYRAACDVLLGLLQLPRAALHR